MNFGNILEALPTMPSASGSIWTNGDAILCSTEDAANALADLIDALKIGDAVTGFYDPVEDERNNEVDSFTGFYYVTC